MGETQFERSKACSTSLRKMANPSGHVVLDEEAARAAEERYAALEAELHRHCGHAMKS